MKDYIEHLHITDLADFFMSHWFFILIIKWLGLFLQGLEWAPRVRQYILLVSIARSVICISFWELIFTRQTIEPTFEGSVKINFIMIRKLSKVKNLRSSKINSTQIINFGDRKLIQQHYNHRMHCGGRTPCTCARTENPSRWIIL